MKKKPTVAVDPTLPKVTITVAGQRYHLVYDFNALAEAEAVTGLNLLQATDLQNLSAVKIRGLLYAALLRAHPEITVEDAGALLNVSASVKDLLDAIVSTYVGSMPEPEKADEGEPKNVPTPESV